MVQLYQGPKMAQMVQLDQGAEVAPMVQLDQGTAAASDGSTGRRGTRRSCSGPYAESANGLATINKSRNYLSN